MSDYCSLCDDAFNDVCKGCYAKVVKERDEAKAGLEAANLALVTSAAHTVQAKKERDEARERARYYADGEVITAGIARLVDRQTQTLIDKAKAAKADAARLREALRTVAERQREADAKAVLEHVKVQRFWMEEKKDDAPASAQMHQIEAVMAARVARAIRATPLVTEGKS